MVINISFIVLLFNKRIATSLKMIAWEKVDEEDFTSTISI